MAGLAADALVILHLAFIVFVVLGGLLVLRWGHVAWLHLPAALWGAYVEFTGSVCPLTPLEQFLRSEAGQDAYSGGFIEHYVLPLLYPENWTAQTGLALGMGVLAANIVIYALVLRQRHRAGRWPFASSMR